MRSSCKTIDNCIFGEMSDKSSTNCTIGGIGVPFYVAHKHININKSPQFHIFFSNETFPKWVKIHYGCIKEQRTCQRAGSWKLVHNCEPTTGLNLKCAK